MSSSGHGWYCMLQIHCPVCAGGDFFLQLNVMCTKSCKEVVSPHDIWTVGLQQMALYVKFNSKYCRLHYSKIKLHRIYSD